MDPKASTRQAQRANGQKLTRRRFPLSCNACRIRKLKCNRETPCSNCLLRGPAAASCSYVEKPNGKSSKNSRSDAIDMRNRISRLESSILSIMAEKKKQNSPSSSTTNSGASNSLNNDSDVSGGQNFSVDTRSTHWDAILHEIGAMKDAWSEENDQSLLHIESSSSASHDFRPTLFGGLTKSTDRSTILADLPSRNTCDILIARFFDSYSPALPAKYILHRATFLKQYNAHWADPEKTKIIWIGLLFAVICISMHTYIRVQDVTEAPPEYQDKLVPVAELFRLRTAECILHADITKPQELLLETLMVHSLVEYTYESDGSKGVMLLSSMIMRLALTQGYHRDPEQHPHLTVFQQEMRRRVWGIINQYELLFSAQYGVPKMIRYAEVDTKLASNLYEDELFEEMTVLPPSRPISERTDICYQIVKYEIMRGYGNVIEFLHIVEPQPYREVMQLDEKLMKFRQTIPAHLQLRSLPEMQGDPGYMIMERYTLEQIYHKSICVLHRKYWKVPTVDNGAPVYYYSRRTCVASSMSLLDMQATMHQASAPGGPLEKMKWYHFSITNHDFLLAAMILSLDLVCEQKIDSCNANEGCYNLVPPSERIYALKKSLAIWTEIIEGCDDAKRATHIIQSVLKKLEARPEYSQFFSRQPQKQSTPAEAQRDLPVGSEQDAGQWNTDPFFEKQFSISIPATAGILRNENTLAAGGNICGDPFAPGGGILEGYGAGLELPMDFDWEAWDQFANGNTAQPPMSFD